MSVRTEMIDIERRPYESADFWRVSASMCAHIPEKLHHPDVCNRQDADARQFSTERMHSVHFVDLPTKALSMTLGGILPGQRTGRHRHNYETVIYVIAGQGRTYIEERKIEWQKGDALYIPVWAWHHHENRSEAPCLYVACENAPLLQNLGGIALREEEAATHAPITTTMVV